MKMVMNGGWFNYDIAIPTLETTVPVGHSFSVQAVRDVTGELMPLSPSHSAAATEAALSAVSAGLKWESHVQETQLQLSRFHRGADE